MSEEFVPLKETLELIELGFSIPCFAYCSINGTLVVNNIPIDYNFNKENIEFSGEINVPTYHQAFKWFRDKYGLVFKPFDIFDVALNKYIYKYFHTEQFSDNSDLKPINHSEHIISILSFKSYELAEFDCIKKFIKLVKKNENI